MWNIVSDSSCDLRMAGWDSPSVRFETVPLRIQVGTREFLDDDNLMVPDLLDAMAAERDDLADYVDLFGTHPKYGLSGRPIASVTYRSQPYQRGEPLYARV